MYSSPQQRFADIEVGAPAWATSCACGSTTPPPACPRKPPRCTPAQRSTEVVTAQGRTVPASETPWMRAREVLVHAVDLGTGTTFADLPGADFLEALCLDVVAKRGDVPEIDAPLDQRAAWLTGSTAPSRWKCPTSGAWL